MPSVTPTAERRQRLPEPDAPEFPVCEHDRPRPRLGLCVACYSRYRRQVEKATKARIARRLQELADLTPG